MGVIETDKWLENYFNQPWELSRLAKPEVDDAEDFYEYLTRFGMYRPSRNAYEILNKLKEEKVWDKINNIYLKYRKQWKGPAVDIYIFPIQQQTSLFRRRTNGRSGLAFHNKLFLFISEGLNEKELEALFVHEYHHSSRLSRIKKKENDYTLLDSIMFEGFAELAVLNSCGIKYLAPWTNLYTKERLRNDLRRMYEPNFYITRKAREHDDLLFGRRGVPLMLGYAIGFEMAKGYVRRNKITIHDTFSMPSEKVLSNNEFLES
ncbi:DUF2268 domain-containing protein [Lederbergia wuyishanensis]|uniref:Uncharacterized protein YjaZ n=1 Tax=Lederbergia wuyishanensis TaxID=1347903 RepID=A0ABU0CYZ0_9BACI|nr:DUF2268 domain-containing putative Zn-dependent protease [Lederbergia wuyishanensis]MCJ8005995.1 DUF2268 domain-containing protein [Lederbergia wuyishanensis]MDQ0341361.1 uncharacterized protein YjaZ [Lederbergia wuyishanensis]